MEMPVIISNRIFLLVCLVTVLNGVWLASSRVDLFWPQLAPLCIVLFLLVISLFITHNLQATSGIYKIVPTISATFQGIIFLNIAWLNMRILNHLSMTSALPYQDNLLTGWDNLFGIEWLAYFEFVHKHQILIMLLDVAYTSLTPLSVIALLYLILTQQFFRARFFLEAFFFTALIAISLGAFFPAEAAVAFLIPDISAYSNFSNEPGVYHIEHMKRLRESHGIIVLYPNNLPGLVTFPSLHTAAGIIFIVTFWKSKVFAPVFIYSIIMIAATPVFGGHYIVDLLAGALLALSVMYLIGTYPSSETRNVLQRFAFSPRTRL